MCTTLCVWFEMSCLHMSCILFVTQSTGWEVGGWIVLAWPCSCFYYSRLLICQLWALLLLSALFHTSNPLTLADTVNCLPCWEHLLYIQQSPHLFSCLLPSSSCAWGTCVTYLFQTWQRWRAVHGSRDVTLITKVYVNASPAQSALYPSSSSVCLSAGVSTHSSTGTLFRHTSSHLIFVHRARF